MKMTPNNHNYCYSAISIIAFEIIAGFATVGYGINFEAKYCMPRPTINDKECISQPWLVGTK